MRLTTDHWSTGDAVIAGIMFLLGVVGMIGALWLLAFVFGGEARAHDSWISREHLTDPVTHAWCCDERDTREETDNIVAVPGGYLVKSTGEVIPKARVIWRSPGGWWRARNLGDGSTRCLIGPPLGM
jgi:hypothetical protein